MPKLLAILLILSICNASHANEDDMGASLHIYPYSCILGFAFLNICPVYLALEKPLNPDNALIIKPSLWYFEEGKNRILQNEPLIKNTEVFRLGSDFGFRHYIKEELFSSGYLQWQIGAFYLSLFDISEKRNIDRVLWLDFMGYLGFAADNISVDFGLGFVCAGKKDMKNSKFEGGCTKYTDMNIAFRIPL